MFIENVKIYNMKNVKIAKMGPKGEETQSVDK